MSDEDRNKALLHRFYRELWSQGTWGRYPSWSRKTSSTIIPSRARRRGAKDWPRWSPRGGPLFPTCARLARI
jgi:hypothetical protein